MSKYGNRKTEIDGYIFDSKAEAEFYLQLKLLKKGKKIRDFVMQPKFELQPSFKKNGKTIRAITYTADFLIENEDGTYSIVDVKGMESKDFQLRKKMFEYKYPDKTLILIKKGEGVEKIL